MKQRPRRGRAPRASPTAKGPITASTAIAAALDFHGITDDVRAGRVITEWSELVGPKIAQRTRPDGIVERQLWIEVASSAWLQELNLLRPQLLAGLRERLGAPSLFDDLKFRLAGRSKQAPLARKPPRAAPPLAPRSVLPATGVAREQIVREAAAVDDDELRELIARVRITHDR